MIKREMTIIVQCLLNESFMCSIENFANDNIFSALHNVHSVSYQYRIILISYLRKIKTIGCLTHTKKIKLYSISKNRQTQENLTFDFRNLSIKIL